MSTEKIRTINGKELLQIRQLHIQSSNHGENLRKNLSRVEKKKKPANGKNRLQTEHSGGESGIRTHGSVRNTTFRESHLRPLGHLSVYLSSHQPSKTPRKKERTDGEN